MQNKSGTANNPISIDEEQTTNERQLFLQATRNKIIIQEAQFTSQPLDLCFAAAKISIGGDTHTKQRQLNRAIISYFKKEIGINISCEHFQPKIEPDYSNPDIIPNPCELLIYGVDFLTTKLIKDRFTLLQAQIREIVWINDSICKLIYNSAVEAEQVVKDQAIQDSSSKSMKIEQESEGLPREWFSIKTYQIFSFERLLWARYATLAEKNMDKTKKLAYQKFAMAKQELGRHLLTEFNAISKYKILVQDIERKRYLEGRRHRSPERNQRGSRTRQKYRGHSRFRRQFEGDRRYPNNRRNKCANTSFEIDETRLVRYAHHPSRTNNDSFAYDIPQNYNNNRDRDQNTSFRYDQNRNKETKQYLDFHKKQQKANRNSNNNLNTSFNYNPNIKSNQTANMNLSFRQQQNRRVCYDAPDESELSFNQFGSVRRPNNERDDFNCDFNQEERRSLCGGANVGTSFVYDNQRPKNNEGNTSFQYNPRSTNKNTHNESFNLDNGHKTNKEKMIDESFVINPNKNETSKRSREEQDFFERLNSVVSSVRQINEEDFNVNQSFEYDKNVEQNNKKSKQILSQSFYNQDSY